MNGYAILVNRKGWFLMGAAAICQEAIDWIEEVVLILTRAEEKTVTDKNNDKFRSCNGS
jgi:hypothetical protein